MTSSDRQRKKDDLAWETWLKELPKVSASYLDLGTPTIEIVLAQDIRRIERALKIDDPLKERTSHDKRYIEDYQI